ncbi:MAG TPA: DUF2877 domain-containing protein [Nocardioides sp.]|jgi:hypothetical protein|nr:DUF2877 domain-containing protein [Nocardioides sp.]
MTRLRPGSDRALDPSPGIGEIVPVASPPRVAAWVAAAPDGPVQVLHACADTVHLDVLGRAVGVAAARAPALPHTLRTNLSALSPEVSSEAGSTAYVDSGLLYLDGRALVTHRLVDVRAPRLGAVRMPRTGSAAALGTPRPRGAGLVPFPSHVDADTVGELVGRGEGLTPLGDDVLCGWLATHRALGIDTPAVDDAVRRALPRTTTLSATLLECALAGEVADLVGAYLRALGTSRAGSGDAVTTARAALTTLGHSSGAGLAHGVDLAAALLTGQVAA